MSSFNSKFYCIAVAGATDYEYRISNTALGYNQLAKRGNSSTDFQFNWVPAAGGGIRYGQTYDVEVRAKVGGIYGNFGSLCQLSIPVSPLTTLQTASCNFTLPTFNSTVYCNAVAGASPPVPLASTFTAKAAAAFDDSDVAL